MDMRVLICRRLVSCVPNVSSFTEWSTYDCPFGILVLLFIECFTNKIIIASNRPHLQNKLQHVMGILVNK
jgi:hypothetical protein